jgi:hypothetical protein
LTPIAGIALAFDILALCAISYEELPEGIRAGAADVQNFLDPSIKALAAMLSFLSITTLTHILLHYLLRRRKSQHKKKKEERHQKAISSFSSSTIEDDKRILESKEPLCRYLDTFIPSTLLAIIKISLTLSPDNTIWFGSSLEVLVVAVRHTFFAPLRNRDICIPLMRQGYCDGTYLRRPLALSPFHQRDKAFILYSYTNDIDRVQKKSSISAYRGIICIGIPA